jgi:hypothetical protein
MLPHKAIWKKLADDLPYYGVLIVLPAKKPVLKQALLSVAKLLASEGHQVRVVPVEAVQR